MCTVYTVMTYMTHWSAMTGAHITYMCTVSAVMTHSNAMMTGMSATHMMTRLSNCSAYDEQQYCDNSNDPFHKLFCVLG